MSEIKIVKRDVTPEEAQRRLNAIFDDVQAKFHDQWDWMDAYFLVEVLMAHLRYQNEDHLAAMQKLEQERDALINSLLDAPTVHTNILRGTIALTKAQAIHIAGLPADIEHRLSVAEKALEIEVRDRFSGCRENTMRAHIGLMKSEAERSLTAHPEEKTGAPESELGLPGRWAGIPPRNNYKRWP